MTTNSRPATTRRPILPSLAVLILAALPSQAILFFSTGDPAFNTSPPAKALANSGWQYQGAWGTFCGTVISSNCFITAKHVGGAVNDTFRFQGLGYLTVDFHDDPESDLRIWRVAGRFPTNAPLYTKPNEKGKALVVFGRGTQRGTEVRLGKRLKGWQWGPGDGVLRWGQNRVNAVVDGGVGVGTLLRAPFRAGGRNQATLSAGDSGGAVFVRDGRVFKLAGINYAVDGPYNFINSGDGFEASLFDQRGLFVRDGDSWIEFSGRPGMAAGAFYATRVSSRIAWINSVLELPPP